MAISSSQWRVYIPSYYGDEQFYKQNSQLKTSPLKSWRPINEKLVEISWEERKNKEILNPET